MSRGDMAVVKDPAIKLFGRTISVPDAQCSGEAESLDNGSSLMMKAEHVECKNDNFGIMEVAASLERCKDKLQTSGQRPISYDATSRHNCHQEESHGADEPKAPFKRPDKILPCPRCNSSETKFCYFNNYNVNQPRHFCKSCQRYWTAGGTVRNVPVGAGRRRNKHLASQYRQIIASSDGGHASLVETPDSTNHQLLEESSSSCTTSSPNEMVLKFGPESPHCDSTRNLLSQQQKNGYNNNAVTLQQSLCHYSVPSQITPMMRPSLNNAAPNVSLQFVPASYWNCIPVWVAGAGNISLALSNGCASPPFFSAENGLQVLGKHPRDTNTAKEEMSEKAFSVPKPLRIHDTDEA